MDGKDIYRSAKLIIDQFGDDAPIEAAMRADALLEKGEPGGDAPRCCQGVRVR